MDERRDIRRHLLGGTPLRVVADIVLLHAGGRQRPQAVLLPEGRRLVPGSRLGQGGRALRETFAIVRREALTVCDARYWEMELRRGLPLATTDRAMRQSAHKLALAAAA